MGEKQRDHNNIEFTMNAFNDPIKTFSNVGLYEAIQTKTFKEGLIIPTTTPKNQGNRIQRQRNVEQKNNADNYVSNRSRGRSRNKTIMNKRQKGKSINEKVKPSK